MPRLHLTPVFAGVLILLIPIVASAFTLSPIDPVTTYTNGMPLASSDPLRSHDVYYRCDAQRVGCCGGHYNLPCCNSLCWPNDCSARRAPYHGGWGEPIGGLEHVEPNRYEQLGSIPGPGLPGLPRRDER